MDRVARRMIKLGGSLLDLADVGERFGRWLSAQPPACNALIVGGGSLVDALRQVDRIHQFDQRFVHQLCLEAMDVTGKLAVQLLPNAKLVGRFAEIDQDSSSFQSHVLSALALLTEDGQGENEPLPLSWDVTSDSIAAWAACRWPADELVLLKSTLPESGLDAAGLAAAGIVDAYFPQASALLQPVRLVNLRQEGFPQIELTGGVGAGHRHSIL